MNSNKNQDTEFFVKPTAPPSPKKAEPAAPANPFPWGRLVLIVSIVLALGVTVILSVNSWELGQWPVGLGLGALWVFLTVWMHERTYYYLPQTVTVSLLSAVSTVAAYLNPETWSVAALGVIAGSTVALIACAYYAYDEYEDGCGMLAVALAACQIALAVWIHLGYENLFLCLAVSLALFCSIALIVRRTVRPNYYRNLFAALPWRVILSVAVGLIVLGTVVGISVTDWELGQWPVGILLAILTVALVCFFHAVNGSSFLPQICVLGVLSLASGVFGCCFPAEYATVALWFALGSLLSFLACACFAHTDYEEGHEALSVILAACNLAILIMLHVGFDTPVLWLTVCLLPLSILALICSRTSQRVRRLNRRSSFSWLWASFFLSLLLGVGVLIRLFANFWPLDQWLGIPLAVIAIVATFVSCAITDTYLPQIWILGILSAAGATLACLSPQEWSEPAMWFALGCAASLFGCTYYAYDDMEEGIGAVAAVLMGCNLAVATTVLGGFSHPLLWILLYLLPAAVIAAVIAGIYNHCDGDSGGSLASLITCVLLGLHVLLTLFFPHFTHSLHAAPVLQDKEFGPKEATCYCGETIEVSQFMGDWAHALSCEHHDIWHPLDNARLEYNETSHRAVCKCGTVLGSFEEYSPHELKDGACTLCYFGREDKIPDEALPPDEGTPLPEEAPADPFPWLGVGLLVGCLLLTILSLSIFDTYLPQIIILGLVSAVNTVLGCLMADYGETALFFAVGIAVSLMWCAHSAYDDAEEGIGALAVVLTGFNAAVALTVMGGFENPLPWLFLYLLPATLLSWGIVSIYNNCDGENGFGVAAVTAGVIFGLTVLSASLFPHFYHSLHSAPRLPEKEFGTKNAECHCGETIEISQFMGNLIHAFTCEACDPWNPTENAKFESTEESHRAVCQCGMVIGSFEEYEPHRMENGVCAVCGYREED